MYLLRRQFIKYKKWSTIVVLKWFQNGKRSSDRWLVLESVLVTLVKWLSWVGPGVPGFILAHVTVFERDGRLCWMQNTRKSPRLKGDVSRVHNQPKLEKKRKKGEEMQKKPETKKKCKREYSLVHAPFSFSQRPDLAGFHSSCLLQQTVPSIAFAYWKYLTTNASF
jgi:hypothetical protein